MKSRFNGATFHLFFFFFLLPVIALPCVAQNADFFYFILQWPGSDCGTKQGCCYPQTGKPASDFIIYGLQPYSNLGSPVTNCDPKAQLRPSEISNLTQSLQKHWPSLACPSTNGMTLWSSQWKKYGTCSGLNQNAYFAAAINLKMKVNLLQILTNAGIQPNGKTYDASHISDVIRNSVGYEPGLRCNRDKLEKTELNLVYLCADGRRIIDCPGMSQGNCNPTIKFPSF